METKNTNGMTQERKRYIWQLVTFAVSISLLFCFMEFTTQRGIGWLSFLSDKMLRHLPHSMQVWLSGTMTTSGIVVCLFVVLAFCIFVYNLYHWVRYAHYHDQKSQNIKMLGSLMFLLWSLGWGLFLQAFLYYPEGHLFVNSELLLRSAIASLDLFMLDIDSNVLDILKGHAHLKGAIAFISLLSFACTIGLLLSLVYARLAAYIKLRFFTNVGKNHPHLYVFWGINTQTELLAKSVGEFDDAGIKIFVEQSEGNEDDQDGWGNVVTMLTHRRESFKKTKELNARLSITGSNISSVAENDGDVLGELSLNSLKKQIKKLNKLKKNGETKPELHLFFLSDNEDFNIQSVAIIRKDETIINASNADTNVRIYCHARCDSVNRVIENTSLESKIQVQIVDSAHLSVELLKTRDYQSVYPVNFVKVEKDATVSTGFNSLVVGFGEAGQDAVRYLYEYGAFVSSDKTKGIRRSPFCCHVVDCRMSSIAPHYMNTHLRNKDKESKDISLVSFGDDDKAYVNLHNYDYRQSEFQQLINTLIHQLHYVVIAIGDDIEGITLAVRILKLAIREKVDLRTFKILVRSYSNDLYTHVQKIANYYNGLAYAELISSNRTDSTSDNGNDIKEPIVIFGKQKEIYSFQTIVSDKIYNESVQYYNSYNRVTVYPDKDFENLPESVKQEGKACSESQKDYAWKVRREKEMAFKIEGSTNFASVMSVRRKEAQDVENALHRHVKRYIALKALDNEATLISAESGIRYDKIKRVLKSGTSKKDIGHFVYEQNGTELEPLTNVMNTLAQMEHLRWNASHEMLGYVKGKRKDEAVLEHNCLTSWEKLETDEIRGYDFDVVDRSFRLADEERVQNKT